ncbi:M4A4D protein, partial [Nothocercus nigrocapillus]|nr:M4A4D protein [Nothocercus nigrocapillus]
MAASPTDADSVRIFTEVIPADGQEGPGSGSCPASFHVHHFKRAQPRALGALHIVTGIIRFCCGIFLTLTEHHIPPIAMAKGLLFWLGLLLLVTGSLLVESGKRENVLLVKTCCIFSIGVILSTLVATIFHAMAINTIPPSCEQSWPYQLRDETCFHTEIKTLSDSLNLAFIVFSLLEFCTAVSALTFGCGAFKQRGYGRLVRTA